MKRAVVLSGGGAKGAYQIGVWKALRKLGIKYDLVTGTSIGSINGLMMVQNDFNKAEKIWKNIGHDDLFEIEIKDNDNILEVYKKYAKEFLNNGGIETNKMYDFLKKSYNEKKFKSSQIDYALVTINLSKFKPTIIKKKNMNHNFLKYILASSTCYPAFQFTYIDDCKFIDGGYYDNMPIQTAIDMGAEEIIAIDLGAIGIKKKIENRNIKIKYITPKNDLGNFLIFNKFQSRKSIKYGYNDTMKAYGKLDGKKFTFNSGALQNHYLNNGIIFFDHIKKYFKNKSDSKIINNILDYTKYTKILNKKDLNYLQNIYIDTIEYASTLLNLDDTKVYNIKTLNHQLKRNIGKYEEFSRKYIKNIIKTGEIKRKSNKRAIMIFIYNELKEKRLSKIEFIILINIYTKEFFVALYIYLL